MPSQIKTECKLLILAELIEASDDATLEELQQASFNSLLPIWVKLRSVQLEIEFS
jgi:hypothetical protein